MALFRALAGDFVHCVLLVELVCGCPAGMFQNVTLSPRLLEHCINVIFVLEHLEHAVGFGVVMGKESFTEIF